MNVRSVVQAFLGPQFVVASLALALGCGPKEPPRQANIPEPPDPLTESGASSDPSSHTSASSSGKTGGDAVALPAPGGKIAVGKAGEPPHVASLASFTDGLKWGMSHAEVTKHFTQTGGVIWKDYDERLAKARLGPEQSALEAEREQVKAAFSRSYIEFKDTPTGYDSTGLRGEYTYNNKEALMWIQRQGKKRYFFFINDRLWKMYDEIPLTDGGLLGNVFLDAVNILNAQLNAQGRVRGADESKGIRTTTVEWKDGSSHLRLLDRSGEQLVGVVVEDNATLANLAALRPNKAPDPNEIDPSILAVTRGTNRTDPNASPAPSASASTKPAPQKR
ncbi:MAG TPA: hypothetical protein VM580_09655 [Labilithrix sp.]|nr:hypothetical protein [Labilithrix sp.]